MKTSQALMFVEECGIVLESANGAVPSLVQFITGEKIKGSWWTHPQAKEIFSITRHVRNAEQILVCRLIAGKVTFVHQRLWPALICCAQRFEPQQIAQLIEEHTAFGKHSAKSIPFPDWVPNDVSVLSARLVESQAWLLLKNAGVVKTK